MDTSAMDEGEEWRTVAGYEGFYEVSSLGRVRSVRSYNNTWPGRLRSIPFPPSSGRGTLRLSKNNVVRSHKVEVLVTVAFHGAPPPRHEANHKDGDKRNNRATNLEWVTHAENLRHSREVLGKDHLPPVLRGEANPWAKFTEEQVSTIIRRQSRGERAVDLAREYGCNPSTVHGLGRRSWSHLAHLRNHNVPPDTVVSHRE